jgi:proline dehydrogenase
MGAGIFGINHIRADSQTHPDDKDKLDGRSKDSLGSLLRTYVVYSMCSIPGLIDVAPKMLDVLTSIPLAREITQAFVRITFFDQVCHFVVASYNLLMHDIVCGRR